MANGFLTRMPRQCNGDKTVFSKNGRETTGDYMLKSKTESLSYIIHKKINSKQIKDLDVIPPTTKLLKKM